MKLLSSIRRFISRIIDHIIRKEIIQGKEERHKDDNVKRIRLILKTTATPRSNQPVRVVKVDDIYDVHLFMLRLCEPKYIHYRTVGSLLRCNVRLPNNQGTLILREKKAEDPNKTIAVLKVNIPLMAPKIEKVIFRINQNS